MRGNAQPDGRLLGGSELRSYFSPFVHQCTPNYVCPCGNVCSLQRGIVIHDFLLRCGDIRDQVTKLCEITLKF